MHGDCSVNKSAMCSAAFVVLIMKYNTKDIGLFKKRLKKWRIQSTMISKEKGKRPPVFAIKTKAV